MGSFFPTSMEERLQRLEQGLGPWIFPELLNGCENASVFYGDPRFKDFGYRLGIGPDGYEFCGHLVIPSSPVIVAVMIEDMWPQHIQSGPIDIADGPDPGAGFVIGRAFVDPDTGEITVTLP